MKTTIRSKTIRTIAALTSAILLGVTPALATLIDDFSSGDLSAYTLSRVNDGNTTANVSFLVSGGALRVSYTGSAAYEQVLLLRNDYNLPVGYMLLADVVGTPAGWDRDIGIAVGYTVTPPSLPEGQSGDVRSSYVEVSVRANNQVMSFARNGTSNLQSGQEFTGTGYYNWMTGQSNSFTAYPDALFIARLSENNFAVGWIEGSVVHPLTANGSPLAGQGYYTVDAHTLGGAVGFYADVRAAIEMSPAGLDNLRIVPIPEPNTVAFTILGWLMLLAALHRRE